MRRSLLALGSAVALLAGLHAPLAAAPTGQVQPSADPKTAVVERLPTGHIAVTVRVNDQGPFRLILDTGSPITFLSKQAAIKLGLMKPETNPPKGLLAIIAPPVQAKSLNVGEARLQDFTVMVLDHPTIEMLGQVEGPLDGIVGFSFFSHFKMTLDYSAGKATFVPTDYTPTDVVQTMMKRLMGSNSSRRVIAPTGLWGFAVDKGATGDGVSVTQVFADSAATAAGLRAGEDLRNAH